MRVAAIVVVLLVATLGGCMTSNQTPEDAAPPRSEVRLSANAVHMDIPVPVFLIGFPEATADGLRDVLRPMTLQATMFASDEVPLVPTVQFEVYTPDEAWQAGFDAFLASAAHRGNPELTGFGGDLLDGNAIEAYLARTLDEIHVVPDGLTSLVVVDAGVREHAYHYAGDVGWREPVRLFGERDDLIVWDPHAEADPWVGTELAHHRPTPQATPSAIAAWAERATAIRALQMPIWPPTTQGCHAVTIVLAVRSSSVTSQALGLQSWEDALDVDRLEATFQNLTGDDVHVDLEVKHLPQDDPPLEAATRENNARAVTQTYLDENFESYHVPHEGCEPYLSLVVYGDLADQRTSSNGNAIMMTPSGRRISTSLVAENVRVMTEAIGYNEHWDESTNFERVGPGADPHEWFNWVVSHETGHLFSLPHPNYATGDPSYSDAGFASTWNVMGYQMRRIVTEMSQVDANNLQRNQAALALVTADDIPQEALDAMGEYRWKDVTRLVNS